MMDLSCPVCNQKMIPYGSATYYDEKGFYKTPLMFCSECDLFKRIISNDSMRSHYCVASYIRLENERKLLEQREHFFEYILKILIDRVRYENSKLSLLDFGSSYGHLLEIAAKKGFEASGVEANENLVKYAREKGLAVYRDVEDIDARVDAITLIDSLYCVADPLNLLQRLEKLLHEGGILIIRITNRNWLLRMKRNALRSDDFDELLGDATIGYSLKSLTRLLNKTGYRIEKTIFREKGKKLSTKKALSYYCSALVSSIFKPRLIVSPGIIVIARKHSKIL